MRKTILVVLVAVSCSIQLKAQTNLDSLYKVWQEVDNPDSSRIEAYYLYIFFKYINYDPDSSILLFKELYDYSLEQNNAIGIQKTNYGIGAAYLNKGQYIQALRYLKESERSAVQPHSGTIGSIARIYSMASDTAKAKKYHQKALDVARQTKDKRAIAGSLINLSSLYHLEGKLDTAMTLLKEGIKLSKDLGASLFVANGLVHLGQMNFTAEKYDSAYALYKEAVTIYNSLGYKSGLGITSLGMGLIHSKRGEHKAAEKKCLKAYKIAGEAEDLLTQYSSCECLYNTNKALNKGTKALEFHERMTTLRDSFEVQKTGKKLQQMEFQKELLADSLKQEEEKLRVEMEHQKELQKKNRTRNTLLGSGILVLLLAGGLWSRLRYVRKSKAIIEKEKDRSENLLLNILPAEIAEELKEKGEAAARDFDMVSILFTDFKGFTEASARLTAADLVDEINVCFKAFDGIIEKYGIEKIKTIGDAYMAAGGLPIPADDSIRNTVLAALEMQAFITQRKKEKDVKGEPAFEMRVGIHTGPVVAGIVGVKKFQYDIWGDTVNTASRIESKGEVGKVNISQATYALIKDDPDFSFESRGKIEAKGKGEIEMYFIELK